MLHAIGSDKFGYNTRHAAECTAWYAEIPQLFFSDGRSVTNALGCICHAKHVGLKAGYWYVSDTAAGIAKLSSNGLAIGRPALQEALYRSLPEGTVKFNANFESYSQVGAHMPLVKHARVKHVPCDV